MINWKEIPRAKFAKMGNAALAKELGCSPQNVAAARARLDMPPSPEKQGGPRRVNTSGKTRINIPNSDAKRILKALKKTKLTLNQLALLALNQYIDKIENE